MTVLHRAAKYVHVEICESILKHLIDKNPKCKYTKITPLHEAARFGHFRVCELIIKHIDSQQRLIPHTNYRYEHVDDEKNPTNVNGWISPSLCYLTWPCEDFRVYYEGCST